MAMTPEEEKASRQRMRDIRREKDPALLQAWLKAAEGPALKHLTEACPGLQLGETVRLPNVGPWAEWDTINTRIGVLGLERLRAEQDRRARVNLNIVLR